MRKVRRVEITLVGDPSEREDSPSEKRLLLAGPHRHRLYLQEDLEKLLQRNVSLRDFLQEVASEPYSKTVHAQAGSGALCAHGAEGDVVSLRIAPRFMVTCERCQFILDVT